MKQLKSITALLALAVAIPIGAQNKASKTKQSFQVDKDVTIDLNTSYCNIEFDTWNRGTVEIEAFVESKTQSEDELQAVLNDWDIEVEATSNNVSINTKGNRGINWAGNSSAMNDAMDELRMTLADMPELPKMPKMPMLPDMPAMPELPPLPEGLERFEFDYKAYEKDGEKYMEEFNKKMEGEHSKEFEQKMEQWGEQFGKQMEEKWGPEFEKKMEAWGEKMEEEWSPEFEKRMEVWGERFEKRMEGHEKRMEAHQARQKAMEERNKAREQRMQDRKRVERGGEVIKTIRIKMPKKAKLKVDVRHGELKLAEVTNLKANLVYSPFLAESINGSQTSVSASYAPVAVTHWNLGELNLNYVQEAKLGNVQHLLLNAKSSGVEVDNLLKTAILDGSFGELIIHNIDKNFNSLTISLKNSEAVLALPQTDFNLQFKGDHSQLKHPENTKKETVSNYILGSLSSSKTIVLNTKFSEVELY